MNNYSMIHVDCLLVWVILEIAWPIFFLLGTKQLMLLWRNSFINYRQGFSVKKSKHKLKKNITHFCFIFTIFILFLSVMNFCNVIFDAIITLYSMNMEKDWRMMMKTRATKKKAYLWKCGTCSARKHARTLYLSRISLTRMWQDWVCIWIKYRFFNNKPSRSRKSSSDL